MCLVYSPSTTVYKGNIPETLSLCDFFFLNDENSNNPDTDLKKFQPPENNCLKISRILKRSWNSNYHENSLKSKL